MSLPYQPSFRCHQCGRFHPAEAAGIFKTPTRCTVCDGTGFEVLATATPERLAELDLTPADVTAHTPLTDAEDQAQNLERCQAKLAQLEAKQAHWSANKDQIVARVFALDDAHEGMVRAGPRSDHPKHVDEHVTALSNNRQDAYDLTQLEWLERDEKIKAELIETIAEGGKALPKYRVPGGSGVSRAVDRTAAFDKTKSGE